jgi:hypothetical protein
LTPSVTSSLSAQRQPGAPTIDSLSASIYGRVTVTETGGPLRRAEVRAMNDRGISRLATTDAEGRYELRDLPTGEYRLVFSKSGFVTLGFGQTRPAEAFRQIELAEGQRVSVDMSLPRAGAIAGRILDESGEPVADVRVQAMRSRIADGQRRLQPAGVIDTTDDRGAYRVFGLEPGDYYVVAMIRTPTPEDARMSAVTGPLRGDIKATVPVFFPGTPSIEQAQAVTLGLGEIRADIFLSPLRTARVGGVVLDSAGTPAADALVELRSDMLNLGFSAAYAGPPPLAVSAHTEPDGSFDIPNVPPGSYSLFVRVQNQRLRGAMDALSQAVLARSASQEKARLQLQAIAADVGEIASMPLVVGSGDITGLTLVSARAGTLTATFDADAGITRSLPRAELQAVGAANHGALMNDTTTLNGVRQFRLAGLAGPTRFRVTGLPDDWMVKAIMVDGTDVTDVPINIRGGNVDARVILTDRVTEVSGIVPPRAAAPGDRSSAQRSSRYVVLFPADSTKWSYPSRFVKATRTDARGSFRVTGLPGNERYLAVAVDYLEEGQAEDPQFLDRVRSAAVPFPLNEGERKTIEVRPIQR